MPAALNFSTSSQSCRRACGSSPVVGSSRNNRSGSPTSEQARASRCFCPPERPHHSRVLLLFELDQRDRFRRRGALFKEAPEET